MEKVDSIRRMKARVRNTHNNEVFKRDIIVITSCGNKRIFDIDAGMEITNISYLEIVDFDKAVKSAKQLYNALGYNF